MNRDFRLISGNGGWSIAHQQREVVSCSGDEGVIGLREVNNKGDIALQCVKQEEDHQLLRIFYKTDGWEMVDVIHLLDNGFYAVERSWTNTSNEEVEVVLYFDAKASFAPSFYFIPCVNYNGNRWGNGKEPKGLTCEDKPWVFAYNRMSLPSATFSENDKYSVGLFSSLEGNSRHSACSLLESNEELIHRVIWPEREEPYTYSDRDKYSEAKEDTIIIKAHQTFSTKIYLSVNHVNGLNYGWTETYDKAWAMYNTFESMERSPEQVWNLGISYAKNLLEVDDNEGLFNIGLLPDEEDGWAYRTSGKYEIGWCGQHASLGTALIKDYLINGNKESLQEGIKVLDTWVNHAPTDNGLFKVQYSEDIHEIRKNYIADTCNLGWGAWYMIEAYSLAKEAGITKSKWLEMALNTCDFFVENYNKDFFFGKAWNVMTGECIDEGGTIGAFMIIPLIEAYKATQEDQYLQTAIKAYKDYVKRDLDNMQCTAGALDTCCVDKETCWPLLKTGLDLYEITGEDSYLQSSEKAGYYLLSWMMHFDTVDEGNENDDFKKYGYKTFGGTSVSAQHHHLDPWGALIACDWIRLSEATKDTKWLERAKATWQNSLYCISDGTLEINDRIRPKGSQNEAYFHCNWQFHNHGYNGNRLNDWLVAWPTAFRLVTLMRIENWELLR